jgi:protein involved in polysaccharide export with SLBB domain
MKNRKSIVVLILISLYVQLFALPINVSIIGNTDNPGVYILDSSNRVSQAIDYMNNRNIVSLENKTEENELDLAGFDEKADQEMETNKKFAIFNKEQMQTSQVPKEENNISYRKVILLRNGEKINLNLQDFFLTGDLNNNPYLENDDVIKLLPIEYKIELLGQFNRPGTYEFLQGERLSDLVEYGLGFTKDADLENIRIDRINQETGELTSWLIDYNLILADRNHPNNIELEHNDVIKVSMKPYLYSKKSVKVMGLVKYPGEYSIDDSSTLLSVLEKSGGPLAGADLNFAMLIDESTFSSYDPDLERLLSLNITTMTVTEYSYYQTKLREISGKHFIDIKQLWQSKDKSLDRQVRDGDIIYIRPAQMLVNVSGAVQNAGLQPWQADKTWQEYIADAGGYTNTAYESKIRVIRYDTNVWVKIKKDTVVNPGDEIFIPEKLDKTFWEYFTEGLSTAAQLITIVLGVHTLTQ